MPSRAYNFSSEAPSTFNTHRSPILAYFFELSGMSRQTFALAALAQVNSVESYSWPSLVWPNTEELISRPFVGENRFRLVLLKRMSTENAVGCLLWLSRSLFFVFHSLPCPLGAQGKFSRGFVPKGPIWICHHSNFGFLLYFLSDRIIETNNKANKGGNVVISE